MDLELLSTLRYYFDGARTDLDSLTLEAIRAVGPGGQFLTSPHPLRRCRTEPWAPTLGPASKTGGPGEAIQARLRQLLEQSAPSPPRLRGPLGPAVAPRPSRGGDPQRSSTGPGGVSRGRRAGGGCR
ncbi:MAG: trimethylamine methyltransferase family protein [Proteobacteria bacterium]|nr:trimethylamine methyltransferase family protein [Pseudomonadota bacterium]